MDRKNLLKIRRLRHVLHSHAELSGEETETKKILMEFMKAETDFTIVDRGNWFYCRKDPAAGFCGRPIAFRADMDALPIDETLHLADSEGSYTSRRAGVSHKCGHDGHCAALCGVGLELTGRNLTRPVILIFQHAEETGKGGEVCASLIKELGIAEIYAFHNLGGYPEGSIVVREGLSQPASKGLIVHFRGKESHASDPEEGNNPCSALCDLERYIRTLLAAPHKGMILCTIVNIKAGSRDFGVSAGDGEIAMTLRAEYESEMEDLETAIRKKACEYASRDGLMVSFETADPFPETRNDTRCLSKVVSCASMLGDQLIYMTKLWRASEDFGWYLKQCPGAIFYIGNGEDYPPLHTCGYDFNDSILEKAVDLFSALCAMKDDECEKEGWHETKK